jgi:hypothetical protein
MTTEQIAAMRRAQEELATARLMLLTAGARALSAGLQTTPGAAAAYDLLLSEGERIEQAIRAAITEQVL